MEKRQRTRLASAGVLAVVFASGTLVGMAVSRSLAPDTGLAQNVAQPADSARPQGGPNGRGGGRGNRQRSFIYEQVLSPEQMHQADSLFSVHRASVQEIERQFRREADSILDASGRRQQFRQDFETAVQGLRASIRSLMTAEQQVLYDSLLAQDDQRRQAEEDRRRQERGGRSGNRPD